MEQDNELPDQAKYNELYEKCYGIGGLAAQHNADFSEIKRLKKQMSEMVAPENLDTDNSRRLLLDRIKELESKNEALQKHCREFIYGEENPEEYEGELARLQRQLSESVDPALVEELISLLKQSKCPSSCSSGVWAVTRCKFCVDRDKAISSINESIGET